MKKLLVMGVLVLFVLSGVSAASACHHHHKNNFKTYNLGETFIISLKSNPTTGYEWQENFDHDYLELIEKTYIPDPIIIPLFGVGGCTLFTFKTLKPGLTQLVFNYQHSWDPEAVISKEEYIINITQ